MNKPVSKIDLPALSAAAQAGGGQRANRYDGCSGEMTELLQAQVRSIGEHYVVARLTTLGFIVGLAPENTRAVDIIAMSEDGTKETYRYRLKPALKAALPIKAG